MPAATTDRRICMGRMGASVFCGCYPAKYRSTDSSSATNSKFTRVRVRPQSPRVRVRNGFAGRCGTSLPTSGSNYPNVIASQRIRPEVAGPMTGSAKQSILVENNGLLRRPPGASQWRFWIDQKPSRFSPRALGSPATEQALRGRRAGPGRGGGRHRKPRGDIVAEQRDVCGRCRGRVLDQRAAMAVVGEVEVDSRVAAAEFELQCAP
jgi:hypothetical protein